MKLHMKQLKLDKDAFDYLNYVLDYDNELCESLLSLVNDNSNRVTATVFTSSESDKSTPVNFKQSGDFDCSSGYLPDYLKNLSEEKEHCSLLIDDVMASPGDDYLEELDSRVLALGEHVYHIVKPSAVDLNSLKNIVNATAVSWHFVCAVLKVDASTIEVSSSLRLLDLITAEKVTELIIGAFDGDGFVHFVFN